MTASLTPKGKALLLRLAELGDEATEGHVDLRVLASPAFDDLVHYVRLYRSDGRPRPLAGVRLTEQGLALARELGA